MWACVPVLPCDVTMQGGCVCVHVMKWLDDPMSVSVCVCECELKWATSSACVHVWSPGRLVVISTWIQADLPRSCLHAQQTWYLLQTPHKTQKQLFVCEGPFSSPSAPTCPVSALLPRGALSWGRAV